MMLSEHDRKRVQQMLGDMVRPVRYPDVIARYAIEAVPKIVINDRVEMLGAQPESTLVAQVVESVRQAAPTPEGP